MAPVRFCIALRARRIQALASPCSRFTASPSSNSSPACKRHQRVGCRSRTQSRTLVRARRQTPPLSLHRYSPPPPSTPSTVPHLHPLALTSPQYIPSEALSHCQGQASPLGEIAAGAPTHSSNIHLTQWGREGHNLVGGYNFFTQGGTARRSRIRGSTGTSTQLYRVGYVC